MNSENGRRAKSDSRIESRRTVDADHRIDPTQHSEDDRGQNRYSATTATHFNSIAIGVGNAVMPSVVRHGAVAASAKNSA